MGTLYLVATPIGNLEDITFRALRVLREVSLIAAEDTRTTRKLLNTYDIRKPMVSYQEHNKLARLPYLLKRLEGEDIALVSEAGTPAINDPGYELVRAASEMGITIVSVPGPSAVTAALSVSGISAPHFRYLGFLPRKAGERLKLLASLADDTAALVALETPRRLRASLASIQEALGDRRIAVCRELTKLHEEVFRGKVSEALAYFPEPRGEFTLVVEGATGEVAGADWKMELQRLHSEGLTAGEASRMVAHAFGIPRREAYQEWLRLEGKVAGDRSRG